MGTEMRAVIGALQEYVDREEDRLRREQQERYPRAKEEERLKLEQRFVSGADCGWTPISTSAHPTAHFVAAMAARSASPRAKIVDGHSAVSGTLATKEKCSAPTKVAARLARH